MSNRQSTSAARKTKERSSDPAEAVSRLSEVTDRMHAGYPKRAHGGRCNPRLERSGGYPTKTG
jgi:hypothetical protein